MLKFDDVFKPENFNKEEAEVGTDGVLSEADIINEIKKAFEAGLYSKNNVILQPGCYECVNDGSIDFTVYTFFEEAYNETSRDDIRELRIYECNECGNWFIDDNS